MVIHYGAQSITFSRRPIIMGALLSRWVNWLPPGKSVATLAVPSDANFTEPHHLFQSGDTDVQTLLGGGLMLWLAWAVSAALIAFGRYLLGDTYAYGFGAVMRCFLAATAAEILRAPLRMILPASVAIAVSVISLLLLTTGWTVILAALIGGFVAALFHDE
jgi:predicted branched-subunit amino acid permease